MTKLYGSSTFLCLLLEYWKSFDISQSPAGATHIASISTISNILVELLKVLTGRYFELAHRVSLIVHKVHGEKQDWCPHVVWFPNPHLQVRWGPCLSTCRKREGGEEVRCTFSSFPQFSKFSSGGVLSNASEIHSEIMSLNIELRGCHPFILL